MFDLIKKQYNESKNNKIQSNIENEIILNKIYNIIRKLSHYELNKKESDLVVIIRNKINKYIFSIRRKIKDRMLTFHQVLAQFLSKNFQYIVIPNYKSKQMVSKYSNLRSTTKRLLLSWNFYQFKQILIDQCKKNGSKLLIVNENFTTCTCSQCGHINPNIGSAKEFNCCGDECAIKILRDINPRSNFENILSNFRHDILAGITVGIIALPLALAFGF